MRTRHPKTRVHGIQKHPHTFAFVCAFSCGYPAGTRRNNNAFTTSARRRRRRVDVVKTLSLHHYCVMCPLGSHRSCVSHTVALALYSVRHVEENDNDYGWILYDKISTFERTICFPYQVNCVLIVPHPGLGTHSFLRQWCNKLLSRQMVVSLRTHIWVTRPQLVKWHQMVQLLYFFHQTVGNNDIYINTWKAYSIR